MNNYNISNLIEEQFPHIYREEGPFFVEFVKKYYEWLETDPSSPIYQGRRYMENHDIDRTADDFVIYFKEKYLKGIQLNTATNTKEFVKNAIDLYRSKGTENSIRLFFDLVFSSEAKVYYPGTDVFKLSDAEYVIPKYLEVTPNMINRLYVGRVITGSNSGATAYVEKLVRRKMKNSYAEVFYISAIDGNFQTGEKLKLEGFDGDYASVPNVVGSLNSLDVEVGGSGFSEGEIVDLHSRTGNDGKATVTQISSVGGIVNFSLVDGGWGYTVYSEPMVSDQVIRLANTTIESSSGSSLYNKINKLVQSMANVQWYDNTAVFSPGDLVYNYYSNGALIGESKILSAEYGSTNTTNYFLLNTISGDNAIDANSMMYYTAGNTASFKVQNAGFVDVTAQANVVGNFSNISITCSGYASEFNIGDIVYQSIANNEALYATTVTNIVDYANGTFILSVEDSNNLFLTDKPLYRRYSNTIFGIKHVDCDVGLINANNTFRSTHGNYITDDNSDSDFRANIKLMYTGSGADFNIGHTFSDSETISINNNFLREHIDVSDPTNWINASSYGADLNNANIHTQLDEALNFENVILGTINNLEGMNPGSNYNRKPIISVFDPLIGPLDKKDFVIKLNNSTGLFLEGERVNQSVNDAKGIVKYANTTAIHVKRLTFADRWEIGNTINHRITGEFTGFTAYPSEITYDTSGVAGHNAVVNSSITSSDSSVLSMSVIDSGFGFVDGDEVTFSSNDKMREGTAYANVKRQGSALGMYKTNSGFLSSNKYMHDGYYYQDFSYEIKSPVTSSKYVEMLKNVLHVAGTEVFSSILRYNVIDSTSSMSKSSFNTSLSLSGLLSGSFKSAIFDFTDRSFARSTSNGFGDVALNGPAGLWVDQAQMGGKSLEQFIADQPELFPDGSFDDPSKWDLTTSPHTISDGVLHVAEVSASRTDHYTGDPVIPANTPVAIRVSVVNSTTTFGINFRAVNAANGFLFNITGNLALNGEFEFIVPALPVSWKPGIYRNGGHTGTQDIEYISIKALPGNLALQPTAGARPAAGNEGAVFDGFDGRLDIAFRDNAGSSNMTIVMGVRTTDPTFILLNNLSGAGGASNYLGRGYNNTGTDPTLTDTWIDGVRFEAGVATRQQIRNALYDGQPHIAEFRNVNLTTWTGLILGATHHDYVFGGSIPRLALIDNADLISKGRDPEEARKKAVQMVLERSSVLS